MARRETIAAAIGGVALGGLAGSAVGLPIVGAAIAGANGAIGGHRRTYDWSSPTGVVAFALDSTWALTTTAAGLVAHVLGTLRGEAGYEPTLSERQNRHVYRRGFQLRRGFAITYGNVVAGAGDVSHPRRAKLIADHENVHVWQARWFGPLFPVLYGGWMLGGALIGAGTWLIGGRRRPLGRVVESAAYYLNPFEYWAYSRDGNWPPPGLIGGYGPRRAVVRPFSGRAPTATPQ